MLASIANNLAYALRLIDPTTSQIVLTEDGLDVQQITLSGLGFTDLNGGVPTTDDAALLQKLIDDQTLIVS